MIPNVIHYCWVGPHAKSKQMLACIESWKKHNPDFSIKEWNETNFDIEAHPFTRRMKEELRWAFVSDYMRLAILEEHGGIYLDTDMFLVQPLTLLLNTSCLLGEESVGIISAGMIGAVKHHPFITTCRKFYDENPHKTITIPRILTEVWEESQKKNSANEIVVCPPRTFYPFDAEHIKEWHGQTLDNDVYGVHLWAYTWGSPLNKLFKRIGVYSFGKKVTEALGVKKSIKKLLGFV